MSMLDHAVSLFGYDRALLERLSPKDARRIRQLAGLGFLPVFGAGGAAALMVWLSERHAFWTPAIGTFIALLVLNLLRLHNSGGGPAPHHTSKEAERWAPGAGGVLVLGLLAVLSAQPWLVWAAEPWHHRAVEAHRAELLATHEAGLARALAAASAGGAGTPGSSVVATVRDESPSDSLARCGFVALRLRLLWRSPEAPLLATTALALAFLSPLLLGHLTHLGALRRYQRLRWLDARDLVLAEERATQKAVAELLGAFPGPRVSHLNVVPVGEVRP